MILEYQMLVSEMLANNKTTRMAAPKGHDVKIFAQPRGMKLVGQGVTIVVSLSGVSHAESLL
ncbi:hypothetical protein [uncultured Alcanivorax sp.]|jgi:hypothetical protein|uniref:hypothetical protein n=1 Tax=uncultured Alcanivorax sp. TaxID=191215 RepID=UPI002628FC62|nr:hypothetical protein [uncultured Alcanivorax sp.]